MGVYVYALRSKVIDAGNEKIVGLGAYSYRDNNSFYGHDARYKRVIAVKHAHAEKAFVKVGDKVNFMVYADKHEVGLDVYAVKKAPVVFDDYKWPGEKVGKLVKRGRNWDIEYDEGGFEKAMEMHIDPELYAKLVEKV